MFDVQLQKLMQQFEETREKLNKISKIHGIDHPDVLDVSKQLDDLHMQILKAQKNKKG